MRHMELYKDWLLNTKEGALYDELMSIGGDSAAIEERFYRELEFGTAGLRGIIGAGTNRMNIPVVIRATLGLADYILEQPNGSKAGVCIAYDSRIMSAEFARKAADVLTGRGIRVYLFSSLRSVPQLSFTLRRLSCIAGIMITASHNPANYNGYKVYSKDGGQITPDIAGRVTEYIAKHGYFESLPEPDETLLTLLSEEADEPYYEATMSLLSYKDLLFKKGGELPIVYTPLHGAGLVPVTTILSRIGIKNVFVVQEQAAPDGRFPTVKYPNPEDEGAFDLGFKLADSVGASIVLATDPDSDRLGAAARRPDGSFQLLTGNQIGAILIYHLINARRISGTLSNDLLVVKSIVSTSLADSICEHNGVAIKSVPTGFRFIAEIIERCDTLGDYKFLFGFEESYGFLAGGFARDKDAILAAMLLAEASLYFGEKGKTLIDVLNDIYEEFGYYKETVKSYTFEGKAGLEKIAHIMDMFRNSLPDSLGNSEIVRFEDYLLGLSHEGDRESKLEFPSMNMLRLILDDESWVCIRPSGTEPKLKLYIGTKAASIGEAAELGEALLSSLDTLINT